MSCLRKLRLSLIHIYFIKQEVDNFLHKNADVAEAIQQKNQESEKERKAIAGVTKLARERAKKANLRCV